MPSDAALASMAVVLSEVGTLCQEPIFELSDAAHFVVIRFLDDSIGFYPECGSALHVPVADDLPSGFANPARRT